MVQSLYDGLGRCLKRTINGASTVIVYDGWKPIVDWDSTRGKSWNIYGPGPDEILWRMQAQVGHLRYHLDGQGNVAFLLDWAGNIIERYRYDAFGRPTAITDWYGNPHVDANNQPVSWYGNRFMFQGREYFAELGIYDYRNRFYHPVLGRFLQIDPIGFDAGDMNLFRYCGDDPANRNDPTGLISVDWQWSHAMYMQGNAQLGFSDIVNEHLSYQPLDSRSGQRSLTRPQLEREMSPSRPLSDSAKQNLDRGCIGLCSEFQGDGQAYPENAPNTKAFLTREDALARSVGKHKRNFVFAKQGQWSQGRPQKDRKTGQVPVNSISNANDHYNYIVYFQRTNSYAWMDRGAKYGSQTTYVDPAPLRHPRYPETVWYSTPTD